jgi:hypothetical protein
MALNCDAASGLLVLLSRREVKSGKGTVPGGTPRPGGNAESDASSEARERDSSSEGWFYLRDACVRHAIHLSAVW